METIRVDPVTGLPNRRAFLADPARMLATDLMMVTLADARHFNEILRALGHDTSEAFVRAGVARMRSVVPADVTLYHVSVLSIAFSVAGGAEALAVELARCFSVPLECGGIPILTRVGIGIVAYDRMIDVSALLRAALAAAQDSRRSDRGWSRYDRATDQAHQRGFQLLSDLPAALQADDQLSLLYQPKLDMRSGRCHGAEALLRWVHPTLGPIPPGEFIPLIEATAFIGPLTDWVLNEAIRQSARWRDLGMKLRIAVNVSPHNLSRSGFAAVVTGVLQRYGVDAAAMQLEFTEGALATNEAAVVEALTQLRLLGMSIALDDFGTGFCNLSYLTDLPADVLKIDQTFVRRMAGDRRARLLVRGIIQLAHRLEYRVVAEGIETAAIYRMLEKWRCDEGQGYYISHPLDAARFAAWHSGHRAKADGPLQDPAELPRMPGASPRTEKTDVPGSSSR